VCNHCADECDGECNYTPKKRHKVPGEHGHIGRQIAPYGNRSASFLVSDMAIMDGRSGNGDDGALSFYGQNVGSSSPWGASSSSSGDREGSSEPEIKGHPPFSYTLDNLCMVLELTSALFSSEKTSPTHTKSIFYFAFISR
jgi:hypothetical protein